jgi:hypothetical protein
MRERRQGAGKDGETGLRSPEATTEERAASDAGVRRRRTGRSSAAAAEPEAEKSGRRKLGAAVQEASVSDTSSPMRTISVARSSRP